MISTRSVTSASWLTSMPVRPLPPSVFCSTPVRTTRSARPTMAPRRWTSWLRSRSAASPFSPLLPPASGTVRPMTRSRSSRSTSSIPLATWTSRPRWSAPCVCSMVLSPCSMARKAWSRSPRPCGVRLTSTAFRVSASSTRWISSALTSTTPSTPSRPSWARPRWSSSCRSALRTTSPASSTLSA
ncbi:elongation factor EF-G [Bifidobacterium adolescentis CAG:119]|nr:elongation factor EF-G [Bifidobacterium adolescentis CAG:119]